MAKAFLKGSVKKIKSTTPEATPILSHLASKGKSQNIIKKPKPVKKAVLIYIKPKVSMGSFSKTS